MILNYIMFPVLDALWPWIFLTIFVAPFILIIVALQAININLRTPKDMIDNKFCNGWLDNYSCDKGNKYREDFAIMSLMWNGYFCTYASWTVFIALLAYNFRVFASYVILLEKQLLDVNGVVGGVLHKHSLDRSGSGACAIVEREDSGRQLRPVMEEEISTWRRRRAAGT